MVLFILSCPETRNIDRARICAKYQTHSAWYVLVCYAWEGYQFLCDLPQTQIFLFPWEITMTIAASRMYRGLDDFLSSDVYGKSNPPLLSILTA